MHNPHYEGNSDSVVRWVVPPPKKKSSNPNPKSNPKSKPKPNKDSRHTIEKASSAKPNNHTNQTESLNANDCDKITSGPKHEQQNWVIDVSLCRTISTFVEEHLRELSERQNVINKARSRLIDSNLHNMNRADSGANDLVRIRVRDEQTKAIETIRQLTNYLGELSLIKRRWESNELQLDEPVSNRISLLRTNIIQAVNEFVLANNDIDVPLQCVDEYFEYDLCLDARNARPRSGSGRLPTSSGGCWAACKLDESGPSSRTLDEDSLDTRLTSSSGSLVDISLSGPEHWASPQACASVSASARADRPSQSQSQSQLVAGEDELAAIERRRKEVAKLERDTDELRQLFVEFYRQVQAQAEQVDSIEQSIALANCHVSEGQLQLQLSRAVRDRGLGLLVPVTGCLTGALLGGPLGLAIGGKLGGITVGCASSLICLVSSLGAQRCIGPDRLKSE